MVTDDVLKIVDIVGVIVPVIAFVWQFGVIGRKRIGYRAQLDTPVTEGDVESRYLGVLKQLRPQPTEPGLQAPKLSTLSIVLLRIENNGITTIDSSHYGSSDDDKVGLRVRFPGRRVIAMAISEFSPPGLQSSLADGSGLGVRVADEQGGKIGIIDLPKVKLNRGNHYKVLAILERTGPENWAYHRPEMPQAWWAEWARPVRDRWRARRATRAAAQPGTVRYVHPPEINDSLLGGTVVETRSRTGPSKFAVALVVFLVALLTGQFIAEVNRHPTRLDCETGHLSVVGSTAFGPVVADAANSYMRLCPGSNIITNFQSSQQGLAAVNREGEDNGAQPVSDALALADGAELAHGYPELVARPLALGLFAIVVNSQVDVANLDTAQIQRLFSGKVANWSQFNARSQPVHLIGRNPDSGSRATFEARFLPKVGQEQDNSHDCQTPDRGPADAVPLCLRDSTEDLLDQVAAVPGAVGYAELGLAQLHRGVKVVGIDTFRASTDDAMHQGYPFWQTEFAFIFRDPAADSLAAGFLRFLADQMGEDIIRSHRDLPCSSLPNPVRCQPQP